MPWLLRVSGLISGWTIDQRYPAARWKGGGLAGGNARFPPLEQATRRAWGNLLTLACLGDGGIAPASAGKQRLPSLYGSPGAKPGKISP